MRYYNEMKKTCQTCGGTGQLGHFQGVSRFIITWVECADCLGSGIDTIAEPDNEEKPAAKTLPTSNDTENQK
jgi:DnaJ-class molecular chaperone